MKRISIVFFLLLTSAFLVAQTKTFELLNPEAIELPKEQLKYLTNNSWKVDKINTQIRNELVKNNGWAYLAFEKDNKFKYGGKSGDWELVENKYLRFQLDDLEDEAKYNFGGIYSVINLTDTALTLSKVLTSTNDMKRTIYLLNSDYYKDRLMVNMDRYYKGDVRKEVLDSISHLPEEHLLKVGFYHGFYLAGDTIFINTEDSLYKIKRTATNTKK